MNRFKIACLFPVLLYLLPVFNPRLIPEITKDYQYFFIAGILICFFLYALIKNWKGIETAKKKVIISILLLVIFAIHGGILVSIDMLNNGLDFSKNSIKAKTKTFEPTIYILKNQGLFNWHMHSEIGYSKKYSIFYNEYYSTENFLEIIDEKADQISIREYRYDISKDNKKIFLKKSEYIKTEVRIIKINSSKLN